MRARPAEALGLVSPACAPNRSATRAWLRPRFGHCPSRWAPFARPRASGALVWRSVVVVGERVCCAERRSCRYVSVPVVEFWFRTCASAAHLKGPHPAVWQLISCWLPAPPLLACVPRGRGARLRQSRGPRECAPPNRTGARRTSGGRTSNSGARVPAPSRPPAWRQLTDGPRRKLPAKWAHANLEAKPGVKKFKVQRRCNPEPPSFRHDTRISPGMCALKSATWSVAGPRLLRQTLVAARRQRTGLPP